MKLLFPHKHRTRSRSFDALVRLLVIFFFSCTNQHPPVSFGMVFFLLYVFPSSGWGRRLKNLLWRARYHQSTTHFVTFYSRAYTSFSYQLCVACVFFLRSLFSFFRFSIFKLKMKSMLLREKKKRGKKQHWIAFYYVNWRGANNRRKNMLLAERYMHFEMVEKRAVNGGGALPPFERCKTRQR